MNTGRPADGYQFGEWVIQPHRNQICHEDGRAIHLEHKAIEVLCYLLERPGHTVTLDELLDNVWADRVVEPNVIHRNLSRIRNALGDDPHHPTYIETIPKRGYRILAPVQKLAWATPGNTDELAAQPAAVEKVANRQRLLWVLSAGMCILAALTVWWWNGATGRPAEVEVTLPVSQVAPTARRTLPNSVAVLPFTNLSPDADDAFFAAGMHEEIINRLFRWRELSVIARTSVLGYADTSKSVQEIAAELGVQALMTGTVRYEGNRVRIALQLIDAQTAQLLWSETFDRQLDDLFGIQQEIASSVARRLNATLQQQDPGVDRDRSPRAYLLYLQARHLLSLGGLNADRVLRAEQLLNEALLLDPNDITLKMEMGRMYLQKTYVGLSTAEETRELRRNLILDALAINPDHAVANAWFGWHALFSDNDRETAARQYELATALDPTNVNIMRGAVAVMLEFGRIDEARVLAEYVVQHDPLCAICLANLAAVQLATGDFAAAADTARSTVALVAADQSYSELLGTTLLLNGEPQQALSVFESLDESVDRTLLTALAWYELGRAADASAAVDQIIARWPEQELRIATAYAWMEDPEHAFEWLDKAVSSGIDRQVNSIFGGPFDPLLENLKVDPRWLSFLERTGRAPEQLAGYEFDITLPQ